ncbi:hypothetical protein TWF970_005799 [Orbilia oligospora]|uniref:Uncharacterized protein n=1 Tax=Orbilia oligospora TaxID=2813651 RepID=A0A7C8VNZ7_ORBOL|nr:hypothetical protein TWF970_005799 [Orbilia oligospora]
MRSFRRMRAEDIEGREASIGRSFATRPDIQRVRTVQESWEAQCGIFSRMAFTIDTEWILVFSPTIGRHSFHTKASRSTAVHTIAVRALIYMWPLNNSEA